MTVASQAPGCFLCGDSSEWYDRPVLQSDTGVVLAGLGPFTEGYVLVAPRRHIVALSMLDITEAGDFATLVRQVFSRMSDQYGPWVAWEHGGCAGQRRRSACVEHAHLHVQPGPFRLDLPEPPSNSYVDIEDFLNRGSASLKPYLSVIRADGRVDVGMDLGVSQFFRRAVAAQGGMADEWDYAVWPRFNIVERTMTSYSRQRIAN